MRGRRVLAAVSLVVLSALSPSDGSAAKLRECRATCAPRVEDECADLSRKKARRCRKRIVRECRRTGLERCLPPTTTTTLAATTTTTNEPTTTSTTTIPTPQCQNGIREGLEQCDGNDIGDATCPAGSTGSAPACKPDCTLDYGPCTECGNGTLEPGEYCDDGNTDEHDGCSPTCQSECGDGILEPPLEMCDDGGTSNGDGCNAFCEIPMPYAGDGSEPDDVCALQWGISSDLPFEGSLSCIDGDPLCDRGRAGDHSCRFLVYFCVNNPSFTVACDWTGVARVSLVGDSLSGAGALSDGEQTAVLGAFETALEWAGGIVSGTNPERTVTPVVTDGILCGQFTLDVATGSKRTVAVQIEDGRVPAGTDLDQVTLTCTMLD